MEGKGKGTMGSDCRRPGLLGHDIFFSKDNVVGEAGFKARRVVVRMERMGRCA